MSGTIYHPARGGAGLLSTPLLPHSARAGGGTVNQIAHSASPGGHFDTERCYIIIKNNLISGGENIL